jgi:hypothetical protein
MRDAERVFKSELLTLGEMYFGEGIVLPNVSKGFDEEGGYTSLDVIVYPRSNLHNFQFAMTCGVSNNGPNVGVEYGIMFPKEWELVDGEGRCIQRNVWPILLIAELGIRELLRKEDKVKAMELAELSKYVPRNPPVEYSHFSYYHHRDYMPNLITALDVDGKVVPENSLGIRKLEMQLVTPLTAKEVINYGRLFGKIRGQVSELPGGEEVANRYVSQYLYQSTWLKKLWPK